MSEDLAHDAHLRAALRHAPDHALSPPAGLSQTILAAARKAHRSPRPAPAPPPVRMRAAGSGRVKWLQRLSSPRWAGALATGLVAALGLGLWFDLGTEPVIERSEAPGAAMPTPPSSDKPAAVIAPPGPTAQRDSSDTAKVARDAPATPTPSRDGTLKAEVPDAKVAQAAGDTQERRQSERGTAEVQRRAAVDAANEAAARARSSPVQPSARLETARMAESAVEARTDPAVAPASPPALARAQAAREPVESTGRATAPMASELRAAPAPAPAGKAKLDAIMASPAQALLQRARADVASGAARWTWAAPGTANGAPFDDAAQAWLERLAQQSAGRWGDAADRGEAAAVAEVHWWRDGRLQATLRFEADALRWVEPGTGVRRAALDPGTLQRLRSF